VHYLAFVLVPQSIEKFQVSDVVADMLAPYGELFDENHDGRYYSPNPKAKLDQWVVGGRWDGLISGHSIGSVLSEDGKWEGNIVKVTDLPPDLLPAAVITPDGRWHDWYETTGITQAVRDDEWRLVVRSLLEKHRDCFAVSVDYHSW